MFRVVCAVQPVDGAQADAEHGGTGMSAPEMGKKAMKGAENAFELAEGDLLVARVLCLCWPILFKSKDLGCF